MTPSNCPVTTTGRGGQDLSGLGSDLSTYQMEHSRDGQNAISISIKENIKQGTYVSVRREADIVSLYCISE